MLGSSLTVLQAARKARPQSTWRVCSSGCWLSMVAADASPVALRGLRRRRIRHCRRRAGWQSWCHGPLTGPQSPGWSSAQQMAGRVSELSTQVMSGSCAGLGLTEQSGVFSSNGHYCKSLTRSRWTTGPDMMWCWCWCWGEEAIGTAVAGYLGVSMGLFVAVVKLLVPSGGLRSRVVVGLAFGPACLGRDGSQWHSQRMYRHLSRPSSRPASSHL